MKGLKILLLLQSIIFLALTLFSLVFPEQLANAKLGPQDTLEAHYNGSLYLMLTTVSIYAFRNPIRNIAVIKALIVGDAVGAVVGLYGGLTGVADWGYSAFSIILGVVLALGLVVCYPRREKTV